MSRTYETAIKIAASISKNFKAETYAAAAGLTKLSAAHKQLKSAEKAAASVKKLNEAVSSSKARYSQASEALKRLEAAETAAGGATKESTKWRKEGERELARYAKEMDRATKAAAQNAHAMRNLPMARFEASRERLFGARKEKGPLVQKAGEQLRGVASDAMMLGTAALGAGAAMAGLVMKSLKAGDEIGDTADKLGIGSTALQELRYGAKQSGAEVGALDAALKKMAVSVGKANTAKKAGAGGVSMPGLQMLGVVGEGGATQSNAFKQLGLNTKTLAKLKPEQQFAKIADGMAKLKTHSEKAAAAQAIFGKGATEILPFLEEGSAGIKKLSEAAHKYGGIMSPQDIKNADEADKALTNAKMAVFGVANTLGSALLPTATKVFTEFSGWVASNRSEIQRWAENTAKWIEGKGIPAIKSIATEVKTFAGKMLHLVEAGARLTGGFGNLALAVGALRLAPLATSLIQIGVHGFKAAAAMLKYAAATRAVKLAEGGGGEGGGGGATDAAGGVAKKVLLAGAGAVGGATLIAGGAVLAAGAGVAAVALHQAAKTKAMIDKFNSENPVDPEAAKVFGAGYARAHKATVRRGEMQIVGKDGVTAEDLRTTMPRTGGSNGAPVIGAVHITVGGGTTEQVGQNLDMALGKLKKEVLDAHERKQAHHRRVSFAEDASGGFLK